MSIDAPALHPIERAILKALANQESVAVDFIASSTGLATDQVRRGIEWLKFKNFISVIESSASNVYLTAEGSSARTDGLPERKLVNAVKEGKNTTGEILANNILKGEEVNAAIANARRNQWIQFAEGKEDGRRGPPNAETGLLFLTPRL